MPSPAADYLRTLNSRCFNCLESLMAVLLQVHENSKRPMLNSSSYNLHPIHIQQTHAQLHKCVCAHAYLMQLCKVDVIWFILEEGGHTFLQCDELAEEGTNVWHSGGGAPGGEGDTVGGMNKGKSCEKKKPEDIVTDLQMQFQ